MSKLYDVHNINLAQAQSASNITRVSHSVNPRYIDLFDKSKTYLRMPASLDYEI